MAAPKPAVFLDRDGVLNEDRADYVKNWGEFRFLKGVRRALGRLEEAGLPGTDHHQPVGRGPGAAELGRSGEHPSKNG